MTIFISVVAYRDPELLQTLKSAMENAIKFSNPAAFADELAAGKITAAEVKEKVDTATMLGVGLITLGGFVLTLKL